MAETLDIIPIRKRSEYLAVAATDLKKPMPGLVLQIRKPENGNKNTIRVGLTVSARAGAAVERSRIKRRLREVIRKIMPTAGKPGFSYVIIGRRATLDRPFDLLCSDLETATKTLHKRIQSERVT